MKQINEKRLTVFIDFVISLSKLSKCTEKQVAAIIVDSKLTQVHSIGINGGPSGLEDCMCITDGKYGCIHAEINALLKCPVTPSEKYMILTLSPCKQCAAAIINSPTNITRVFYIQEWKNTKGLLLLKEANILTASVKSPHASS